MTKKTTPSGREPQACKKCGGVGAVFDADDQLILCPHCKGNGLEP